MLVLLMEFIKCATEMGSGGMRQVPSSVRIGLGIEVTLRWVPQQFERQ
jgi:hypothetical protein